MPTNVKSSPTSVNFPSIEAEFTALYNQHKDELSRLVAVAEASMQAALDYAEEHGLIFSSEICSGDTIYTSKAFDARFRSTVPVETIAHLTGIDEGTLQDEQIGYWVSSSMRC